LLKDGESCSVLRKIKRPNGEYCWEDRLFAPIKDSNGKINFIMESVRDITRFKIMERELSGVRELMTKVIQSSPSAIIAADRKGKVILVNQAAEKLFGYSVENLGEFNIRNLYPEGVAKDILKKLLDENYGEKGKLPITKVTVINKTGDEIPAEMTAAIIYEGSQEVASMGIFNDLRDKLAVEKQLQEAQEQIMQSEKLASLGRLAAGVAHEINNPLTGILLYGNMMLEKLEDNNPLKQNLKYVLEDANRCKEIVKNLLAYSRQSSPSKELFELNSLIESSLCLIRDQKFFMNIALVKELSDYSIMIYADKNQLAQVVINLVMNAVDAMNDRGTLTFRTYLDEKTGMACLEVRDTGTGIPPELISKIFDPFFTTKMPGKGTGLGLSTIYGIVKENNGRISVKETSPEGTAFILELPVKESEFDSIG
jgi:PAS domain S-box-containing protein